MCSLCITSNRIILCVYTDLVFFISGHGQLIIMYRFNYQPIPRWPDGADMPADVATVVHDGDVEFADINGTFMIICMIRTILR